MRNGSGSKGDVFHANCRYFVKKKEMYTEQKEKKSILIVEDDPTNIFITEKYLQEHFQGDSVTNGYDALKAMEKRKYDVILMDINLGDEKMDGIRTMRMIRQNRKYRHTKIFAITAYSNNRESYIKQGFDEFFMKPVNEGLLELINQSIVAEPRKEVVFI
jgi:CheY-like chemotaxis protein